MTALSGLCGDNTAQLQPESKTMDTAAYRLLYDYIHDFKTTAVHVESEIRRHGIRSDSWEEVAGMKGRAHHDMWVSMKTVSHFNLGIALECSSCCCS